MRASLVVLHKQVCLRRFRESYRHLSSSWVLILTGNLMSWRWMLSNWAMVSIPFLSWGICWIIVYRVIRHFALNGNRGKKPDRLVWALAKLTWTAPQKNATPTLHATTRMKGIAENLPDKLRMELSGRLT
jgi:hypothetical protein